LSGGAERLTPPLDVSLLAPLLERPQHSGILTDFDGTIAPIVADPGAAVALPGTIEVLDHLAGRFGRVAVISGRPVSYLLARLAPVAPRLTLRGLYGFERADGGVASELDGLARWRRVLEDVADLAEAEAPAGVAVERKGLAVTLHVRNAPDAQSWMDGFVDRAVPSAGLRAHPGRKSVEIRPPVDTDKGTVVADVARGLAAVCFLGDDRGDLPAFAALRELRAGGVATLAVAVASAESPSELLAQADVVLDGPEAALELLRQLARAPES